MKHSELTRHIYVQLRKTFGPLLPAWLALRIARECANKNLIRKGASQ